VFSSPAGESQFSIGEPMLSLKQAHLWDTAWTHPMLLTLYIPLDFSGDQLPM
jgi:hypothetical protein